MNDNRKALTGVVLAGGKSSRFGTDKALFHYRGKPLVVHALEILMPLCNEMLISTNKPGDYSGFDAKCVTDIFEHSGPLGGIHSALSAAKNNQIAVISCDTPFVPTELFSKMAREMGTHDLIMPGHSGFTESMCAIYSKGCLRELEKALTNGKFRILDAIEPLNCRFFPVDKERFYAPEIFHNINYRKDLK